MRYLDNLHLQLRCLRSSKLPSDLLWLRVQILSEIAYLEEW